MSGSAVERIVEGIADAEDTEPDNLDVSIQRYVSTDAIRNLVKHDSNSWRLQFETRNHVVEILGDDTILIDGEGKR